jgi:hypothetical protein
MTHDAGAKSPARRSFPLSCHPQKLRAYPLREPRLTNNTSDQKANEEIQFLTCWRSTCGEADAGMPGCRTPIRSKGKQRVGAGFYRIRSIETQTAVTPARINAIFRALSSMRSMQPSITTYSMRCSPASGVFVSEERSTGQAACSLRPSWLADPNSHTEELRDPAFVGRCYARGGLPVSYFLLYGRRTLRVVPRPPM